MNLLYISNLSGNMWAGPNSSVPAQVIAQSKVDNVFWYNINDNTKDTWRESEVFYNLKDYPNKKISELPVPFSKPDLIIFEGIYTYPFSSLTYQAQKMNAPYILIPRSELTQKAQRHKPFKKIIGNIVFFKKFIRKASSIQYLTTEEYKDSGTKWNTSHIIIPNGIENRENRVKQFDKSSIKGVYIGRVEIYQKGLDMLIEACEIIKDEMRLNNFTIDIYGPDRGDAKKKLSFMLKKAGIEDIITINEGVFDKKKKEVQEDADFFIMTSRFEGHPMGLIEALSYGLPSLVTKGTNMADEICKINAGWASDTNVEGIAESLKRLIKDKHVFENKSRNAIILAKNYNWDEIVKETHEKYRELIRV